MKPHILIRLKTGTASPLWRGLLLIPVLLVCFALSPGAQAVGPDKDGAIPGSNNGEGIGVLVSRTGGVWNTGTGFEALNHLDTGNQNTATGLRALFSDTSGGFNTATGVLSLFSNTSGFFNSATGAYSLASNTDGSYNSANGYSALYFNTQGEQNTATGFGALYRNATGQANTANGYQALWRNTTGNFNTAIGPAALFNNTTGDQNTALGDNAGASLTTGNGNVCIGTGVTGVAGENNTTRIKNISTTPLNTGMFVEVDQSGKLGFITSSRRYKHDIESMGDASEALYALKPVTFRYNGDIDPAHVKMFGLIAEDVAQVSPELAVRNAKGEVIAIRSDSVNAMLLNEFLKEHRRVEELQATVAQQQKGMEVLTAQLKEQAAQIQKVSAQLAAASPSHGGLEASKFATGRIRRGGPAPKVVGNTQ